MTLVFIASPYAATEKTTVEEHKEYLRMCMADSFARGESPFAPHGLYTQYLSDNDSKERELGIASGLDWLATAEVLAVYLDLGLSKGMQEEISFAAKYGKKIEFRRIDP